MAVINYNISNQHDLIAAQAAILLASQTAPAPYTMTLTSDVILFGNFQLNGPQSGSSLTIVGNGHTLEGAGQLSIYQSGAGKVVLNAASTQFGGVNLYGGTLELARPDALGMSILYANSYVYPQTTVRIDGAVMPVNPINLSTNTLDLAGITTTAAIGTLDTGNGVIIPVSGGGSVMVQMDTGAAPNYILAPDGSGGTLLIPTFQALANNVTVRGLGTVLQVAFDNPLVAPIAQPLVDPLNAAVLAANATPFDVNPGDTVPVLTGGQTLEVIAQASGSYALPTGGAATEAFVSALSTPVTVTGGDVGGQLVLSGTGDLAFAAGLGQGTVIAGGGSNSIDIGAGMGDQTILLGDGNDTVTATGGNDSIAAGGGSNLITLGAGNSTVTSTGHDTIYGGSGKATVTVTPSIGGGNSLAFLSAGSSYNGSGAATVISTQGNDTISTSGTSRTAIFLRAGGDQVSLGGADTILTGSGQASVNGSGSALVFTGTGAVTYALAGSGTDTLVGNPGGSMTVSGGYGSGGFLGFAYGPMDYEGQAAYGSGTIISAGAAITVHAGAAGGAFVGGSAGGNSMQGTTSFLYATGATLLIGGGNRDTLSGGYGPTILEPAAGAATLNAGGFIDELAFRHGVVTTAEVTAFDPTRDFIGLFGFPAGEATSALAGAVIVGGNETIALSDGTRITFQGFTSLTAGLFH